MSEKVTAPEVGAAFGKKEVWSCMFIVASSPKKRAPVVDALY